MNEIPAAFVECATEITSEHIDKHYPFMKDTPLKLRDDEVLGLWQGPFGKLFRAGQKHEQTRCEPS